MIITQKVTTLAFSIHDGVYRDECELSKSQQYHAVRKLPSALEYFAFMLHFQGLLAGPLVFYRDYIEFIEGYQILKHTPSSNVSLGKIVFCLDRRFLKLWGAFGTKKKFLKLGNFVSHFQGNLDQNLNSKKIIMEPSPMKAVVKKVIGSLICAFVFMKFAMIYPIKSLKGNPIILYFILFYTRKKGEAT